MKEAIDFCRFLCGNHKLPVVAGRYNYIERCNRVCSLCNLNTFGDEYHYIYVCPAFNQERVAYIPKNQLRNHNTLAMHSLFSYEDRTSVSNLARFCRVIMDSFKAAKCQSRRKNVRAPKKGTNILNPKQGSSIKEVKQKTLTHPILPQQTKTEKKTYSCKEKRGKKKK